MEKYIKKFPSGSFVNTWLLKKNNTFYFVRKGIFKKNKFLDNKDLIRGQYEWLKKMSNEDIFLPKVRDLIDAKSKCYYDMQYINSSVSLHSKLKKKKVNLKKFFLKLKKFYKKNTIFSDKNNKLFEETCKTKAIPSILSLKKKTVGSLILKRKYIHINGVKYLNLIDHLKLIIKKRDKLSKSILKNFDSIQKTYVHGDLTFENILLKNNKFFLIDPYGGCVDIRSNKNFLYKTNLMFDLGKICQSLVSNYEYWKNISIQKSFFNNKEFFIKKRLLPFLNKDFFLLKNVFGKKDKNFINICLMHMIIHLCRLIRYRVKHNYPSALFAYVIATYCINVLVRNDNH